MNIISTKHCIDLYENFVNKTKNQDILFIEKFLYIYKFRKIKSSFFSVQCIKINMGNP